MVTQTGRQLGVERFHVSPNFPPYSRVVALLGLVEEMAPSVLTAMIDALWDQRGSHADPVDWSNPESWISERLDPGQADLANRLWAAQVNPRYVAHSMRFARWHGLVVDASDRYRLTERGQAFRRNDPSVIREVDATEGVLVVLSSLAAHGIGRRADLLGDWTVFLAEHSGFKSDSIIKDSLRRRLVNLVERRLATKEGTAYAITANGRDYVDATTSPELARLRDAQRVVHEFNDVQRKRLLEALATMPPTRFEELVGELLEALGYSDVEVTRATGDMGIDVSARMEMGITEVTEVVQVKRRRASIQRPVLDQLRGVLPLHGAIKGTIITLGSFSKGCAEVATHPGAAPITLIDGPRLIDLLVEHGIGITSHPEPLLELDEDYFQQSAGV